jgi:hypothetical protein
MKIIVYTASFGPEAMEPQDPVVVNPEIEYLRFTNRECSSKVWKCKRELQAKRPRYRARMRKILPQSWLPPHTWSVWMDDRFRLDIDPTDLIHELDAAGVEIAAMKHPARDNLADEVEEILRLGKAPERLLREQFNLYKKIGWVDRLKTLTASGFLLRKDTGKVRKFNALWAREVQRWTLRDQMSMDNCAIEAGLTIHHLEGTYGTGHCNPYVTWRKEWKQPV